MSGSARSRIGFLGTGIMGFPMARRLVEAGHEVKAWNRTRQKAERLPAVGAAVAATARDAVRDAEVVICMLSSGPVCDEVLLGDHHRGGRGAAPGRARRLVEHGDGDLDHSAAIRELRRHNGLPLS